MCRTAPARVTRIDGAVGWIDLHGRPVPISLVAVDGVHVGDYVLYHAGLALERLEPSEAEASLALLAELDALAEDEAAPA